MPDELPPVQILKNPVMVNTDLTLPKLSPADQTKPGTTPRVTLINAKAFRCESMMQGSQCFCLQVVTPEAVGCLVSVSPVTISLDGVPEEYHDFADIFSKSKAGVLVDHCPYDLKITLEEGASPPLGLSIRYLRKNYLPFVSSLTKTHPRDSFIPHSLHMGHPYSSYRRRTAPYASVAISRKSTRSQRRTSICSL